MNSEIHIFEKIITFLQKIQVSYKICEINQETFLPGLFIEKGTLLIDKNKLKYIGDILHEAGHIALMAPEQRSDLSGILDGQIHAEATEMAAIAWSYAAALEISIDPSIVFHSDGYKGDSENILSNFGQGHYFGVPILQWYGITNEKLGKNKSIVYPKMIHWVRK